MAIKDNTRKRGPVRQRCLTVSPHGETNKAYIRMTGQWLEDAGFLPGSHIRVQVLTRCLVITPEPPFIAAASDDLPLGRGPRPRRQRRWLLPPDPWLDRKRR